MTSKIQTALAVAALAAIAIAAASDRGQGQGGQASLTVAIYAPTVEFGSSAARLSYVQGLADAIAAGTGARVVGLSFTSLGQLKRARPDFAIVDAQCYASNMGWQLLATAQIGGKPARPWALFSSVGPDLAALQGKKLAFVQTGCDDAGFLENAMLESEVELGYFEGRVGKSDLSGAVAEVATYSGAQGVFAPIGSQRGLTKVFDAAAVPNPAFVQTNARLPAAQVESVQRAVLAYGGSGAIEGWTSGTGKAYSGLRSRMSKRKKQGIFAAPETVSMDAEDVLIEPETLDDSAWTGVEQHFARPPDRQ